MPVDTVPLDVVRLDLRLRRRAVLGYCLGLAAYVFVVVALYPTFKDETSLNEFTQNGSKLAALFGAAGSLTSPAGWLSANVYANFLPLIALVLAMGYGASCLAGQDEDGTLALVATLPARRRTILQQKIAVLVLHAACASLATLAVVLAGRAFQLDLDLGPILGATAATMLLAIDFGLLALLIGAWTGSRGTALGVAAGAASASYLIGSLAPVTHWLHPLRYASLFYWSVGNNQLQHGLGASAVLALAGTAVILAATAVPAFNRLDIH